jgi:hypothetical protein
VGDDSTMWLGTAVGKEGFVAWKAGKNLVRRPVPFDEVRQTWLAEVRHQLFPKDGEVSLTSQRKAIQLGRHIAADEEGPNTACVCEGIHWDDTPVHGLLGICDDLFDLAGPFSLVRVGTACNSGSRSRVLLVGLWRAGGPCYPGRGFVREGTSGSMPSPALRAAVPSSLRKARGSAGPLSGY